MSPISKRLVRVFAILLLALVAFPEQAYSGFLSKSFMKEYSQKMCLQAQRLHTSLVLDAMRKQKKIDALKQRQQRGEDIDLEELYNLSCDCVRLNTEAIKAQADIDFWKSVLESYKETGKAESPVAGGKGVSDGGVTTKVQTQTCPMCHGSGRCFSCLGSGWMSVSLGMICPSCIGGVCPTCRGTGKIEIISSYDSDSKCWTAISSAGVAVSGVAGSQVYDPAGSSEPSSTSTDYQHDYNWWARHAESIYNSITREVNRNGDRRSNASGWGYSSSYSGMAGEYVKAQSEMRRIRANALKGGVLIDASVWETKQIRY